MESKLDSYRKTKRRQAVLNDVKDLLFNMVSFQQVRGEEKATHVIIESDRTPQIEEPAATRHSKAKVKFKRVPPPSIRPASSDEELSDPGVIPQECEETPAKPRSLLTYLTYLVYLLFWVTLYAIAIELRFGVVFLMLSALFGIYFNTRTKKAPGEISAYSVFNKNCEAIDGTLKAEQFEREIGIRH
ncbi:SAYSvFN domain-containing protein 1-like [Anopheles albimanus]|uniref:SAYSvFN domain-containing protein 1-like n=1 Tax=Anopheles albimanus TaxID=7167 RepID=UPI001641FE61|nr:SAYSvFN domain-containing protein 1-like [Anopheles albimanus]